MEKTGKPDHALPHKITSAAEWPVDYNKDYRRFFFDHIYTYGGLENFGGKTFTYLCTYLGFTPPNGGFKQFSSDATVRDFVVLNWKSGKLTGDEAMEVIASSVPVNRVRPRV